MSARIIIGDCRTELPKLAAESIQCCVTSPPYWGLRRDYGHADQIGQEATPSEYVASLVAVFAEVRRVLRADGTLWLNLGDSYAGSWGNYSGQNRGNGDQREIITGSLPSPAWDGREKERPAASRKLPGIKHKDLIGIPWLTAFALREAGWWLRSDIIWHKPNPMPESVRDRCTKAHEYIFMLTKSANYFYDSDAIRECSAEPERKREDRIGGANGHEVRHSEGGMIGASATRNKRDVWTVPTSPYPEAHLATFPPDLIKPCILAGTKPGDAVLDPFGGSGTTAAVATELGRNSIMIELNPDYGKLAEDRTNITPGLAL